MKLRYLSSSIFLGAWLLAPQGLLHAQLARLEVSGWASHTFGGESGFYRARSNPAGVTSDGSRRTASIQDTASHAERIVSFTRGFDTTLNFEAIVYGTGYASYGALGGAISFISKASPDTIHGSISDYENPTFNYTAGRLSLGFFDGGRVTSTTLAPGTSVTLAFNVDVQSTGSYVGRPTGSSSSWNAAYENDARAGGYFIVKHAEAVNETYRAFGGSGTTTIELETFVGADLLMEGRFEVFAGGLSGRDTRFDTSPFYGDVSGSIEALNTARFLVDAPEGVTFVSSSGHDYAGSSNPPHPPPLTPVPEPGAYALMAASGLVLVLVRRVVRQNRIQSSSAEASDLQRPSAC